MKTTFLFSWTNSIILFFVIFGIQKSNSQVPCNGNPVFLNASNMSFCAPDGNPVQLSVNPWNPTTVYSYSPSGSIVGGYGPNVSVTPFVPTTYTVTATDANGCTSSSITTIYPVSCPISVGLHLYIEGYYETSSGYMRPVLQNQGVGSDIYATDSVTVELHNSISPFGVLASKKVRLSNNGYISTSFPFISAGNYYIVIKGRNIIETWSSVPIWVSSATGYYDFTTVANKAYGSNQVAIGGGQYAFFSGDLNSDQNIDILDVSLLENDINTFQFGYVSTDINGDGNVDLLDQLIIENNINNFIFSNHP